MTDSDTHRSPWPYAVQGDRLSEEFLDDRLVSGRDGESAGAPPMAVGRSIGTDLVLAAAATLDIEPTELPTLNDRIDPDALDDVIDSETAEPDGFRLAVVVEFPDVVAVVRDSSRLTVCEAEPPSVAGVTTIRHDWNSPDPLAVTIADAVAQLANRDAAPIYERLISEYDVEALDRLVRPKVNGTLRTGGRIVLSIDGYETIVDGHEQITVEPTLAALKRTGSTTLVVGDVPERLVERTSATLLGDAPPGRRALFALHGKDVTSARTRLSLAGIPDEQAEVLINGECARSSALVDRSDAGSDDRFDADSSHHELSIEYVGGGSAALGNTTAARINRLATGRDGSDVRICIDSIDSFVEQRGPAATARSLEGFYRAVCDASAMAHVVLHGEVEEETMQSLEPSFDAVVELRVGDGYPEQRWRLPETGYQTHWFEITR